MNARRAGFTLVELLICVTIVGILVSSLSMLYLRVKTTHDLSHDQWRLEHELRSVAHALRRDVKTAQQVTTVKGALIIHTLTGERIRYRVKQQMLQRQLLKNAERVDESLDLIAVKSFSMTRESPRLVVLKLQAFISRGELTYQRRLEVPCSLPGRI